MSLGIPRGGWGGLKANSLEAKCEAKLKFPGRRGVQNKKPSMGEYGYFLELHNRPNIIILQTPNHYLEKVVHCLLPFFT